MLDMLNETLYKEEENSKSISTLERQIEQIRKKLNQQLSGNFSDTTQDNKVTILCSDKYFDNRVHNPTPTELEVVVEDYVPLYDNNTERLIEIKEVVIEKEKYNEEFHVSQVTKVGEGFVEANTTSYPKTLKKLEPKLLVMDSKKVAKYKQTNKIVDHPFLATIYSHISCREGAIDMIFGNYKVRFLLFGPTNDPPISGDMFVINTIDDYVYEYTHKT
ncbi:unnamed protein product [Lactuca saligna]|uniref:Uncharacterized protein n=1 Tax=Lactuca saligna TaxID=75948 RepID=A0AA35ZYF4_LACSI|nr:unnamed protein product [Lactuca saligna]